MVDNESVCAPNKSEFDMSYFTDSKIGKFDYSADPILSKYKSTGF